MRLLELQRGFASALCDPAAADALASQLTADTGLPATARLQVYRNNARAMFDGALERTYPVLKARLGATRFAQLALEYRAAHPSRHGDLHYVGAALPAWLGLRLADTDGRWLAELARLEWACEEALVAADATPLPVQALAGIPAERLAELSVELHPSLRVVESAYALWSVWRAHQETPEAAAPAADSGAEQVLVHCAGERLALRSVSVPQFVFVERLMAGASLAGALDASALGHGDLPDTLGWLFGDGLVCALNLPEA